MFFIAFSSYYCFLFTFINSISSLCIECAIYFTNVVFSPKNSNFITKKVAFNLFYSETVKLKNLQILKLLLGASKKLENA